MLGINWSDKSKVRLILSIIIAAVFVGALTLSSYWVQSRYYQQAADQSAKHHRWAENEIKAQCPSFGEITPAQCTYQANQAAQENERAEYDLYAQRTSALWASVMAFAALLGIGLSGIGVYLVKHTFDETRNSNAIATETAHNQLRAYITQQTAFVKRRRATAGKIKIEATAFITNNGQTPAYEVLLSVQSFYQKTQPSHDRLQWGHTSPQIIGSGLQWSASATRSYLPDPKKQKRIFVLAEARYKDFTGRKWILYLANASIDGRNLTKLSCCQEGNYEIEDTGEDE